MKVWPGSEVGTVTTWVEYFAPPADDEENPRLYRLNVSFLMSNWECIYGQGCPSTLIHGATLEGGCCQIGVHIERNESAKISSFVKQLGPEDWDNYEEAKANGWKYKETDADERRQGYTQHTRVIDGACIMHNRNGSSGKSGCALHGLALKLGMHPSETKPDICWSLPLSVSQEWDADEGRTTVTISNTRGDTWGATGFGDVETPGWFCTETPDAYTGKKMVYQNHEYELRKQLGDEAYELLCRKMVEAQAASPMPGQLANGGRPMIPLMVVGRSKLWQETGADDKLKASQDYYKVHNLDGVFDSFIEGNQGS